MIKDEPQDRLASHQDESKDLLMFNCSCFLKFILEEQAGVFDFSIRVVGLSITAISLGSGVWMEKRLIQVCFKWSFEL